MVATEPVAASKPLETSTCQGNARVADGRDPWDEHQKDAAFLVGLLVILAKPNLDGVIR
jgi:hypothetical protein